MTAIRAAAESHTGYVRTNNEDLAVVAGKLAALADGMGGHLGGEVAARTAIEQIVETFSNDTTAGGLVTAVQAANEAIWRKSRSDPSVHGMGTTITAVGLVAGEDGRSLLALVNVGDSRAYQLDRRASLPRLRRLTEDHSVVEEMVRRGEISPAEAAVHPHRHVLTRVLGIDADVEVDLWELEPDPGLRILLCSDGLSDDVPEDEIATALASSDDPTEVAGALVQAALSHGGLDNVTVVVLDVTDEEEPAGPGPVSFAPPRPEGPDSGEDSQRADITQALPLARPEGAGGGEPTAAVDIGSLVAGGTGEAALASAAGRRGAFSTKLFDLEAEEANDETVALEATDARRPAPRSLVVRAKAPALLPERGEPPVGRSRMTVLVPPSRESMADRDRVLTFRVVLFALVLAALLGGVVAVVVWFQRSSYYVGLYQGRVSIFQGRPGGLLWFKPQLLEESSLGARNLLPNSLVDVKSGIIESSYAAARQQLIDLGRLSSEVGLAPKSPPSTTRPSGKHSLGVTPTPRPGQASLQVAVSSSARRPAGPGDKGVFLR